MIAINLLKEVLIRNSKQLTNKMVSRAMIATAKDNDASLAALRHSLSKAH